MIEIIIVATFIFLAYITGHVIENRHYIDIKVREKQLLNLPAITTKHLPFDSIKIKEARLVYGSIVISIDYFKRLLAGLRNVFGGELSSYETLIDRARREAILRMKESALGADAILNLRIETSIIGQTADKKDALGSIEVLAYGTAIILNK